MQLRTDRVFLQYTLAWPKYNMAKARQEVDGFHWLSGTTTNNSRRNNSQGILTHTIASISHHSMRAFLGVAAGSLATVASRVFTIAVPELFTFLRIMKVSLLLMEWTRVLRIEAPQSAVHQFFFNLKGVTWYSLSS